MKKKRFFALITCIIVIASILLAGCASKPDNLEALIEKNPEISEEINSAAGSTPGLDVSVSGNDITYTYDLSQNELASEEDIKDETMIKAIEDTVDALAPTFKDLCSKIEEDAGFTGIKMIVNYSYGDEVLVTRTFTSEG